MNFQSGLRLLTEKDRPAINSMIDKLEERIVQTIIEKVCAGATPLFRRGYRPNEVAILGFGPEITVVPIKGLRPIHLWWRRILLHCCLAKEPTFRQYEEIPTCDPETRRLIKELHIFESVKGETWHA